MKRFRYGRKLDDFLVGDTYDHPWEVTVDGGMVALWQASFFDANALCTSDDYARSLGYAGRVVPHALVLNLGLSFSVHDVSQQAIAHLAYLDVRFPRPLYHGDTFSAFSEVLGVKAASSGDRGTVHVRTIGVNQHGEAVLSFERKALIRAGHLTERPATPVRTVTDLERERFSDLAHAPSLAMARADTGTRLSQPFFFEDFTVGDILCHDAGRTVGESEHMMLSCLVRNSHPLHWDAVYCTEASFTKERVVYGGLVLSWVLAAASWDTSGHALWELGLDDGAHPAPTLAGDTLYAASQVVKARVTGPHTGEVRFRVIGVKNVHPADLLTSGRVDAKTLFTPERDKKDAATKVPEKVVEITRDVMLRRRTGGAA